MHYFRQGMDKISHDIFFPNRSYSYVEFIYLKIKPFGRALVHYFSIVIIEMIILGT